MKNKIILFLVLFSLLGSFCFSQNKHKTNSSVTKVLVEAKKIADTNTGKALQLLDETENKFNKDDDAYTIADILLAKGNILFNDLRYEEALQSLQKATNIFKNENDSSKLILCYGMSGRVKIYLGQYTSALRDMFTGLKIAQDLKNSDAYSTIAIDIGLVFNELKDWDNSFKYFKQAEEILIKDKDSANLGILYHDMADAYREVATLETSIEYYKKAIQMYTASGEEYYKNTSYSDLGNAYLGKGALDSALFYKSKAVAFFRDNKSQNYVTDYCYAIASMGFIKVRLHRYTDAERILNECEDCRELLGDLIFAKNYYSFHYEYYLGIGNLKLALQSLEHLSSIKDSINASSKNIENQRIAVKYESEQQAMEDSLNYQLHLSQLHAASTAYRNRMYIILLLSVLALVVGIGLFIRFRNIQKIKRIEEVEKMRQDIAGDLHDDIGSTLSSIQILSAVASKQCKENNDLHQSIDKITNLSSKVADGIRDIVLSINPAYDKVGAVVGQLKKIASDILSPSDIALRFNTQIEEQEAAINPMQRKNLAMAFKEAINNARKYSGSKVVEIDVEQRGERLSLMIKDFGVGCELDRINQGNGLNNMKRRIEELHGDFDIKAKSGEGTTISFTLQLARL